MSADDSADDRAWKRLRASGGYRQLRSFQVATIIYDATVAFCERFVDKRSRTRDQMVQAARSGRQNIAEGSRASGNSSQTELRLVGVARASLDELLLDYEDFLRQRRLPLWDKDAPRALEVRRLGRLFEAGSRDQTERTDPTERTAGIDRANRAEETDRAGQVVAFGCYAAWLSHRDPAIVANTLICLIHQTNYLLDRQLVALERGFIREGGYTERLAAARIAERARTSDRQPDSTEGTSTALRVCPSCGKPMVLRTARKGQNAGTRFWGCAGYPACKGTRAADGRDQIECCDDGRGKP